MFKPRAVRALVVLLSLWFASGLIAGHLLTRRPHPRHAEPPPSRDYEALRLRAEDGIEFGAWERIHEDERAAIILVHGNGASRASMVDDAEAWFALGCTVMPISVRAHGDSEGEFNDAGWSARRDVTAAIAHLREGHPARRIVLHGISLGAAASLFVAADDPHIDGLLLVGPYGDLRDAIRARTRRYLPWGVEAVAYSALRAASPVVLPDLERIRPLDASHRVRAQMPMVVVAGERDQRAPVEVARAIAQGHPRAEVIVAPHLDHAELGRWMHSLRARRALRRLLDAVQSGDAPHT